MNKNYSTVKLNCELSVKNRNIIVSIVIIIVIIIIIIIVVLVEIVAVLVINTILLL